MKLFKHYLSLLESAYKLEIKESVLFLWTNIKVLRGSILNWLKGIFGEITLFYSDKKLKEFGLKHDVSGESETVKTNPKLKNKRTFFLPNGTKQFFGKHVKFTGGFRLHFFPDEIQKKIYIGYAGPHLPDK